MKSRAKDRTSDHDIREQTAHTPIPSGSFVLVSFQFRLASAELYACKPRSLLIEVLLTPSYLNVLHDVVVSLIADLCAGPLGGCATPQCVRKLSAIKELILNIKLPPLSASQGILEI